MKPQRVRAVLKSKNPAIFGPGRGAGADAEGEKKMSRNRAVSLFVALSVVVVSGVAMAQNGHRGGGDRGIFMLAKAAGISRSAMFTAFKSSNLKADHAALRTAKQNLAACLVTAGGCTQGQTAAYVTAETTLATDQANLWTGLFASAPNLPNAAAFLTASQQLQAQRKANFQQYLAGGGGQ